MDTEGKLSEQPFVKEKTTSPDFLSLRKIISIPGTADREISYITYMSYSGLEVLLFVLTT